MAGVAACCSPPLSFSRICFAGLMTCPVGIGELPAADTSVADFRKCSMHKMIPTTESALNMSSAATIDVDFQRLIDCSLIRPPIRVNENAV
jgi:hypothetical protein